ncbi:MAG: (E)-4-hydroxy-3-methylbut-2-enyl-diphosphate synthase, partial [Clostridia bacterium]|nr:(E)-4-hydroxy-3-methylbut-2-enyl-diphosphate synthase [Clostridia bacterium]
MTKQIKIGNVFIGGGNKIAVQSMTNTKTSDVVATVKQIEKLQNAGCDIIRIAVANKNDAIAIKEIKKQINIPLVADIHFDYKLAILSMQNGADKIRINPGNIDSNEHLAQVIECAKQHDVAIRIGVNGGSLNKDSFELYGNSAMALADSAVRYIDFFEKHGFFNIVLSVKSSSVQKTIDACKIIARKTDYPQHVGVTESGCGELAKVKSAIGIGSLLVDGIGDTIRVSLTDDPV